MPGVCPPQSQTPGPCEAGSQQWEAGSPRAAQGLLSPSKVGLAGASSRFTHSRGSPVVAGAQVGPQAPRTAQCFPKETSGLSGSVQNGKCGHSPYAVEPGGRAERNR